MAISTEEMRQLDSRKGGHVLTLVCRIVTLPILLGVLAACASHQPAAQPQSTPPVLSWSPCADVPDTQCATLAVPVDPARPDGATLNLRIARVPASDPSRKKGMLLFIPGGPGVGISGTFGGENRTGQHVEDFAREYDVVTFDPRGVGQSNPIRCASDAVPSPSPPADRPPSADQFKAIGDANAAFFRSCTAESGDLMSHLSAMDTAADIERIREALTPNDGLVAYAGSYGTQFAQAYLERYGDKVNALVLDAVVDHSVDLPTFVGRNVLSTSDAFDQFAQWCKSDAACALHGQDVGAVFDGVVANEPVTRTLVPQLLAAGQDPNVGWPAIATMINEVNNGKSAALNAMAGTASLTSSSEDPDVSAGKNGLFAGVLCSDYGPQSNYDALLATGNALAAQAPRFVWKFWDSTPIAHATAGVGDCAGWPYPATNPPHRLQVGPHPNVMVASPAHDPATPLINALTLYLQIPQAHLLIANVDGHQSLILSACAYKAEDQFLSSPASVSSTIVCAK
jgi:pimeloyl-ACP methyl ester carboxylesterase